MSAISRLRAALHTLDDSPVGLSLPRPQASQTSLDGLRSTGDGQWVPADSRVDQVAGAYAANLDIGTSYMFGGRGGGLFGWSALLSCVRLLSGVCAQLITTPGSLNIRRITDGKTQRDARHLRIREWLANSPDGKDTPAYNWWADFTTDLLLGNALAYRDGKKDRLIRLRAATADVDDSSGAYIYMVEPVGAGKYEAIELPRRMVIHARWSQVSGKQSVREDLFSSAPIIALRANTVIGQTLDGYIRRRFGPGGWKSGAVIHQDFLSGLAGASGSSKFIELAQKWADSPKREFAFPGKVGAMLLEPKMAEMQTVEQRAAQVKDAGRIFGIPAHMLGEEAGAMAASGIEQMSRVFWRTSAKSFVMAILSALSARLLPRSEQFVIDESEFLRGDSAATATLLTAIYQGANMIGPDGNPAPPDLNRAERRHLLGAPVDDELGPGGEPMEPKFPRPPSVKPPPERMEQTA